MFNATQIYENKVEDLARQILVICNEAKIPVFMAFAVKDDENGTLYANEMLTANALGIEDMKDDQIYKHGNVASGFETVPVKTAQMTEEEMRIDNMDELSIPHD